MPARSVSTRLRTAARHFGRSGPVVGTLHLARAVLVGLALLVPSLSATPLASAQDLSECDVFTCSGSAAPLVVGTNIGPPIEPEVPLVSPLPDELPALVDSDGDGFFDADEVRFGSDPLNAESTPFVGPDPVTEPIQEPPPTVVEVGGGAGGAGGPAPDFIIEPSCITEPDECFSLPRVLAEDETTD